MNMNMSRITRDAERMYKRNKKFMLTLAGGAMAGIIAIMISKLG